MSKNLIHSALSANEVIIDNISVGKIIFDHDFTGRNNLDQSNWKQNDDFVRLYENIKENGQHDLIHVRLLEDGTYQLIAGYRRVLALKIIAAEKKKAQTAVAYVWNTDTAEDKLFQIATFTNANRVDLTPIELINQVGLYRRKNPDTSIRQLAKDLSMSLNDAAIVVDLIEFKTEVEAFYGNMENEYEKPLVYNSCKTVLESLDNIKLNIYAKIVKMSQDDKKIISELNLNEFECRVTMFLVMLEPYKTFKDKLNAKAEYFMMIKRQQSGEIVEDSQPIEEVDLDSEKELVSQIEKEKEQILKEEKDIVPETVDDADFKPEAQDPIKRIERYLNVLSDTLSKLIEPDIRAVIIDFGYQIESIDLQVRGIDDKFNRLKNYINHRNEPEETDNKVGKGKEKTDKVLETLKKNEVPF